MCASTRRSAVTAPASLRIGELRILLLPRPARPEPIPGRQRKIPSKHFTGLGFMIAQGQCGDEVCVRMLEACIDSDRSVTHSIA